MPKAIFCLYSRSDNAAEQTLQNWQRAYSRQGWETTVLSHEHGSGFAHEILLGRPRWWPWLTWRLHGVRCVSEEVAKQPDFFIAWFGFPQKILERIRSSRRLKEYGDRQRVVFGSSGKGGPDSIGIFPNERKFSGKTRCGMARPKLSAGETYDLRCGGEKNPYHWLMHAVVPLAICRRPENFQVLLNSDPNPMQLGSLRMMGIGSEQILTQPPRRQAVGLPQRSVDLADAIKILREQFGHNRGGGPQASPIYISRKDACYRRLMNEQAIFSLPEKIRPRPVVMSEKTWEEQLLIFQSTRMICGVHGAAFVFIVFSPQGSTIIEMFPGGYERNHFRHLADLCGVRWERVDCEIIGRQGRRCREADLRLGRTGLHELEAHLESLV